MLEDRVDALLTPVDETDDARREAHAIQKLEGQLHRQRILFGRLDDDGVAARDREGEEPHRDHEGEIERRDRGEDPDRLADHVGVNPARDVLQVGALHERRDPGRDLDALDPPSDLAGGILRRFAVVLRDEAREVVLPFFEEVLEVEAGASALERRRRAPVRKGRAGGLHGGVDVFGG